MRSRAHKTEEPAVIWRPGGAGMETCAATPTALGMLALQQTAGNRAVARAVADVLLSSSQLRHGDGGDEIEAEVPGSAGMPLPTDARRFFEHQFGRDFRNVRVHAGPEAEVAASAAEATAFTVGQDIVFRSDAYVPDSSEGRQLLAHELTHVAQQGAAPRTPRLAAREADATATGGAQTSRLLALIANLEQVHAGAAQRVQPGDPEKQHVDNLESGLDQLRAVADRADRTEVATVLAAFTPSRIEEAEGPVQTQGGAPPGPPLEASEQQAPGLAASRLKVSDPADPAEAEARRNADAIRSGAGVTVQRSAPTEVAHRNFAAALIAFGSGTLALDAEASPIEAGTGPPGWAVGLVVAAVGAAALGIGLAMSSGGRPGRNTDQNRQFADAVRSIERAIGRRLTQDEIRQLHEALHSEENPGFHEIVQLGIDMFGRPGEGEGGDDDDGAGSSPVGGTDRDGGVVGSGDDSE